MLKLETTWRQNTPHLVMPPRSSVQRLAAPVPRPRRRLTRLRGALAPAARLRAMASSAAFRYARQPVNAKTLRPLPTPSMPTPLSHRPLADALCTVGECDDCAPSALGRDPGLVGQALARGLPDPVAMVALRRLAGVQGGGVDLQGLNDAQVLALLSAQVQRGHLQLCQRAADGPVDAATARGGVDLGTAIAPPPGGPSAPAAPAAPASRAPAQAAAPPPAPPAEEAAVEIDAAAQAATLREAAREGVPFCEECEKARRAREAETA